MRLPDRPHDITSTWLTDALRHAGVLRQAVVTDVHVKLLDTTGLSTQIARLTLSYDRVEVGTPSTLILKCSATEPSLQQFFARFYAREVAFYQTIAPTLPIRVPRCYGAAFDAVTLGHVLLLEDLWPAVAGDPTHGVSADVAAVYTRLMATLHAAWWEHPQLDALARTFAPHGSAFAAAYADLLDAGLAVMQPYVAPDTARLARALQRDLQPRWDRQSQPPRSLIHWDAHAANCLWHPHEVEKMAIVDWQNCAVSRGIWDVVRFCVLSLPIDTRRVVARDIVALYVDTLADYGVRHYAHARAWSDYQTLLPLQFAQQLRFFGTVQHWDDDRRHWVAATAPRVIAALHDAASG
jgi:hypothetical protein